MLSSCAKKNTRRCNKKEVELEVKSAKVKKVDTEDQTNNSGRVKKLNASNEKFSAQIDARVNKMSVKKHDFIIIYDSKWWAMVWLADHLVVVLTTHTSHALRNVHCVK